MRFCTPTQGEHGIPYVVPTLMTLTNVKTSLFNPVV